MIIVRQKTFARRHYEGLNAFQGVMVKLKRNATARQTKRERNAITSQMNREIASANRKATRGAGLLSMFGGKFNDVEKDALARGVLNRNQERVNTAFENRNARYDALLQKSNTRGERIAARGLKKSGVVPQDYGVSTITNTYKAPVNQQVQNPAAKGGGMGFGKKLAIGAAAVGATALAANYFKNRAAEKAAAMKQQQDDYDDQQPQAQGGQGRY